ncbi:MAG: hypothetical protein ACRC42_00335 [Mycoplasma sp.]
MIANKWFSNVDVVQFGIGKRIERLDNTLLKWENRIKNVRGNINMDITDVY